MDRKLVSPFKSSKPAQGILEAIRGVLRFSLAKRSALAMLVESIAVRQHFTTAGCQSQGDLQQKLGHTIKKHEKSTCQPTDAFLGNYAEIWRWKSSNVNHFMSCVYHNTRKCFCQGISHNFHALWREEVGLSKYRLFTPQLSSQKEYVSQNQKTRQSCTVSCCQLQKEVYIPYH